VKRHGRRFGGQGAVAFAEAAGHPEQQLAIKFFFSDDAYEREVFIASVEVRLLSF
jgi:hypothetical protein